MSVQQASPVVEPASPVVPEETGAVGETGAMLGVVGMVGEGTGESPSMKHGAVPVSEQASPKVVILERHAGIKTRRGKETARRSGRAGESIAVMSVAVPCRAHDGQTKEKRHRQSAIRPPLRTSEGLP